MKFKLLPILFLVAIAEAPSAYAVSDNTWGDISDYSVGLLAGSALIVPSVRQDWQGFRQAAYSMGAAEGISLLGKAIVHEPRPDSSDNNSFPSGHTTLAFASATTLHRRYGWRIGLPAYAVATLTATARVKARKHHWYDVVAGAAFGTASGWYFTDAYNNQVQLLPWADSHSAGISLAAQW